MNQQSKSFLGIPKEKLSEYICPLLLAASICFASFYTFHKISAYVLTVVFIAEEIFLFRLFDKLRAKRFGGVLYALIFATVFFVSLALVTVHSMAFGYFSPIRWFYAQDGIDDFQPALIAALFIGGGFFLISIVYYFTMVRYRTLGLMLCTMFPFFFFAKRSDIMPDILTTVIMLLFLAVIIHNRRINKTDKAESHVKLQIDRAYIICISIFILITGALTMAIEKPYYQAFLEKNSRLFNPFNIGGAGSGNYEELSETSSPRNGQPSYNYEPLFYFETASQQKEFFLRTKSFDLFNGEVWVNGDKGENYYYSLEAPEYSTDDIVADISVLEGKDMPGLYSVSTGRLFDEDFTPVYLPAPYSVITDDRPASSLLYYKLASDTSVFRTMSFYYTPPFDDSIVFIEPNPLLYNNAREMNFSSEEYISYLNSFAGSDPAKRLMEDYTLARKQYTDLSNVSEKLIELSEQITADCHSDLEKAEKLEKYFGENGFGYSLEYVPEDNSIDYFVFESKTGYCTNYATAMTLMARASGLPARYVEGFVAFEKNDEGQFVIRDGYAHAFVEVYIPSAGWVTFDPTVAGYRDIPDDGEQGGFLGIFTRLFGALNRISVIIIIAVIVLFFSLLDRIRERAVRILLHFLPLNERIISLYANLLRNVGNSAGRDFSAYTPEMLKEYLLAEKETAPETLISLFQKTAFGGYECSRAEYRKAYKEYRRCYRRIRRPLKNRRSKNKLRQG